MLVFCRIFGEIYIFWIRGMPFYWPLQAFWLLLNTLSQFWYSCLHVLMSELIQSKSALKQRCSALKIQCFRAKKISAEQRWFRAVSVWNSAVQLWNSAEFFSSEQRWFRENQSWSALIQRKSELISAETELISADFFSCPLNQRWKTSKLWNSAVQRWLSLGLQPGFSFTICLQVFSAE